jgi:hypothetical protein
MPESKLTPCEEEFLDLVQRECDENGLAIGIFRVGVVMGWMSYVVAYRAFVSLREKQLIRASKLCDKPGQPWAIESETP